MTNLEQLRDFFKDISDNAIFTRIDSEEFDDIVWSLSDDDKAWFEGKEGDIVDKYMSFLLALHRYWDAKRGDTTFDGEIHYTSGSSIIEIVRDFNLVMKLTRNGIDTIGKLYELFEEPNQTLLTDEEVLDVLQAVQ